MFPVYHKYTLSPNHVIQQDQFASNDLQGEVVEEGWTVDNESEDISPPIVLNINEAEVQPPATVSTVPSLQGQVPLPHQRANIDSRTVRKPRKTVRAPRRATAQAQARSTRSQLEEARGVIARIEQLRAEAALKNAKTQLILTENRKIVADSFKLIAQSIDRLSIAAGRRPLNHLN